MQKMKYSKISRAISSAALASIILSGCNSGGGSSSSGTSAATDTAMLSAVSKAKNPVPTPTPTPSATAPVIVLSNSSSNAANCSYFLTQTDGTADGQTPIGGAGSSLAVGATYTWNYADKDKYSTDTTQTAVCGYNNNGWGLNGAGTEEGEIYLEHNTTNNTLIVTATGLPTSQATLTCLNVQGIETTTVMNNNFLADYTCSLNGTSASTVSINFGGALNKGTPPANPANTLVTPVNSTTFTKGSGAEANCMTDNSTGLMWVKDLKSVPIIGGANGSATYYANAESSINAMNNGSGLCGHNDWRLPSINEMVSLINYTAANPQAWLMNQGFANLAPGDGDYWTSTKYVPNSENPYSGDFWIPRINGTASGMGNTTFGVGIYASPSVPLSSYMTFWVLPVRSTGAVATAAAPVAQTGDTVSVGVQAPKPRFATDSSGNCMVDKLTGLTWVKDQTKIKTFGGLLTVANFEEAEQTVARMNSNGGLCGFTDWRMPHVKELASLINYTKPDFAAWLNSQGFNVLGSGNFWAGFWTADVLASDQGIGGHAWAMGNDGEFTSLLGIQNYYYVLPVHGSSAITAQ